MDAMEQTLEPVGDFRFWRGQLTWTVNDASYLLNGFEPLHPDMLDPDDRYHRPRQSPQWRIAMVYHFLKSAVRAKPPELPCSKAPTPPGQPFGTTGPYRSFTAKPWDVIAWARAQAALPGMEWFTIPADLEGIKAPEPAPQPAPPPPPAVSAVAAILAHWTTEPKLPFQKWDELARTFAKVNAKGGAVIDWKTETDQSTIPRGGSLRLCDVDRARPGRAFTYNPEAVAVWLHYTKGAKLRDVGAAIYALVFAQRGDEWEPKVEAWRKVKAGEATLDHDKP